MNFTYSEIFHTYLLLVSIIVIIGVNVEKLGLDSELLWLSSACHSLQISLMMSSAWGEDLGAGRVISMLDFNP